ncbi:MAG: hypothetical protein ACREUQ_05570 [Burkholderiales bacterium]
MNLHITNGDVAVERMREGGLPGSYLAWRDVLHEGPVPHTETLGEISAIRAHYLAEAGYGRDVRIHDQFNARDAALVHAAAHDEVVLWFEHDLFDQLQILQILDWLAVNAHAAKVYLIIVGSYPGIARFVGLGQLSPAQFVGLFGSRIPATKAHFDTARRAWAAFRQPTPQPWAATLYHDIPPLPYLREAVVRMLEELPSVANGLSRTDHAALGVIADGTYAPHAIFASVQALEERPFMSDWSFWRVLANLAQEPNPLIKVEGADRFLYPPRDPGDPLFELQRLMLTEAGIEVLEKRSDAIALRSIDRWFGGTHLTADAVWRWDADAQRLVTPTPVAAA